MVFGDNLDAVDIGFMSAGGVVVIVIVLFLALKFLKKRKPAKRLLKDEVRMTSEEDELKKIWLMRKALSDLDSVESMQLLIDRLKKSKTNEEFLQNMGKM